MPTVRDERHPPRLSVLWALLATLVASLIGTTIASAASLTYDAPSVAGVDVLASGAVKVSPAMVSGAWEGSVWSPVGPPVTSTTPSAPSVATNTADDAARFVADSAGNTTLRAQGPSGWLDVTSHAAKRMTQRGISIADVDQALTQTPFNYWHSNMWKVGYYDAGTNVFVGTANGVATTVITPSAGPQYVANLLAAAP